ncbi:hypothetical protein Tco_0246490 [Tanacetum coccineum]
MGISVANNKVEHVAAKIGCETLKAPFSYLGSKVGDLMSRIQPWNDMLNKLTARLSKWKMKTLSIGGRLTLLKSVLELNSRKPSWVKWSKVLASNDKEGLGVSSLYALNRALLFKWVCRFRTQNSSLRARVIKSIHGGYGKLDNTAKYSHPSIWWDIVREMEHLKNNATDLFSFIKKNRIYALETCKNITVAEKMSHVDLGFSLRRNQRGGIKQVQYTDLSSSLEDINLVGMRDRWIWSLEGTGDFSVASVRRRIDDSWLQIFRTDQYQVNKTKEFLSSNFSIKDIEEADVILVSTHLDPTIKLMSNTDRAVDQFEYSRVIGCLTYAMTSTRPNIAYVVEGYSDASWITNSEDHTSITGWASLLGGCAISWASKKQTCITDSTMEADFVALAAVGKEAEWCKNRRTTYVSMKFCRFKKL